MTVLNIVLIRIEIIGSVDEEPSSVAATAIIISLNYENIDNAWSLHYSHFQLYSTQFEQSEQSIR
jgi:hypothetical protein